MTQRDPTILEQIESMPRWAAFLVLLVFCAAFWGCVAWLLT